MTGVISVSCGVSGSSAMLCGLSQIIWMTCIPRSSFSTRLYGTSWS